MHASLDNHSLNWTSRELLRADAKLTDTALARQHGSSGGYGDPRTIKQGPVDRNIHGRRDRSQICWWERQVLMERNAALPPEVHKAVGRPAVARFRQGRV